MRYGIDSKMIVWFIFLIVDGISGLPDGAPKSACRSLTPRHSETETSKLLTAQTSKAPYEIDVDLSSNKVSVRIFSPVGETFEGFILQARSDKDPSKFIDGEFTIGQISKTIDCFGSNKNTLTHVNRNSKTEVMTEWTPKENLNEGIIFVATVAKQYDIFWADVQSKPVKLEYDSESVVKEALSYENCFKEEGCIGLSDGCVERQDCEVLLRYSNSSDGIKFNLEGFLKGNVTSYIAMAWSEDPNMGEDSVTECIRDGTNVIARESWNEGKSNSRTKELSWNYTGSFVDGVTSCSWTSPFVTVSNGQTYDFANKNYYILLAAGEVLEWKLRYHNIRMPSREAINLTEFNAGKVSDPKVEESTHDIEEKQPPVTPTREIDSTSHKDGSIYTNETITSTSGSPCLKSACLTFILSGLIFLKKSIKLSYF